MIYYVAAAALGLFGAFFVWQSVGRPPRCAFCGLAAEPLREELLNATPPVVQVVFWCPRCAELVSRRVLGPDTE